MKRIAKKNLQADMYIEYGHSNTIYNFAPRVCNKHGELIGYITFDTFYRMKKSGELKHILGDTWYSRYALA